MSIGCFRFTNGEWYFLPEDVVEEFDSALSFYNTNYSGRDWQVAIRSWLEQIEIYKCKWPTKYKVDILSDED